MFTATITEKIEGYTYFTATNKEGVEVDFIIYNASTEEDLCIWIEVDTVRGVDYDKSTELSGWDYDGLLTEQEGIDKALYFLYKVFQ